MKPVKSDANVYILKDANFYDRAVTLAKLHGQKMSIALSVV